MSYMSVYALAGVMKSNVHEENAGGQERTNG